MSDIRTKAMVRHPSYGTGTVVTVAFNWRGVPKSAEVEFVIRGLTKRLPCQAGDLTVVETPRPGLRVVEPVVA